MFGAIIGAGDGTRWSESARIPADRGTLAVDSLQLSKSERLVEDRRERRPGSLNHVAQSALAEQLSDLVAQHADPFRVRIEVETAVREVAAHTLVVIEPKDGPARFEGGQQDNGCLSHGERLLAATISSSSLIAPPCLKTSDHTLDPSPVAQDEGIGARLFERYNIVSDGDFRTAAEHRGLTGTIKGQPGTLSPFGESTNLQKTQ
jgi:hypothetical protein